MACHTGKTRGVKPASGTANTRPLIKVLGAGSLPTREKEISPNTGVVSFLRNNRPITNTTMFLNLFASIAQNVKDDITVLLKLLCALANIHHGMCNEMIVFEHHVIYEIYI